MKKKEKVKVKKRAKLKTLDQVIQSMVENFLSFLGVEAEAETLFDKEGEVYLVNIHTQGPALLIGRHGETVDSLQTVLSQMVYRQTGQWNRILVDVEGYREKREQVVKSIALEVASRVKDNGTEQPIYDLSPSERRIVHMFLSEDSEIETESVGEGRERHLLVKPKK